MRPPRFRLRTLLIAVAVMATSLGCLTRLARPYPWGVVSDRRGPVRMDWSDDSSTIVGPSDPVVRRWRSGMFLIAVDWTDGRTSWHLWRLPWPLKNRGVRWVSQTLAGR